MTVIFLKGFLKLMSNTGFIALRQLLAFVLFLPTLRTLKSSPLSLRRRLWGSCTSSPTICSSKPRPCTHTWTSRRWFQRSWASTCPRSSPAWSNPSFSTTQPRERRVTRTQSTNAWCNGQRVCTILRGERSFKPLVQRPWVDSTWREYSTFFQSKVIKIHMCCSF